MCQPPWVPSSVSTYVEEFPCTSRSCSQGMIQMGGALTRNSHPEGFRTYWYIAAAIYAVSALVVAVFYNPPPRELQLSLNVAEKLFRLDWIGYILLTIGLVLFCMGLSWSQNPYPWTNAHVLATFLTGVVFIIALMVYQWRFKRDGMFHHDLFRHRNFPLAVLCIFCEGISFFGGNNYFAFEVSTFYTTDAFQVGLHYSVAFYTFAFFAIVAGIYCWKTKTVRIPSIVAFSAFLIFNILMATAGPRTPVANIWAYPIFLGIGLGICLTSLMTAAQFATPAELIAITSGLMISVRSLGGSVGLAIYTAIFNSVLTDNLGPKVAAAALPLGLPESSLPQLIGALATENQTALASVPGITPNIIAAAAGGLFDAFGLAFRYVWVAAGSFASIAVIGKSILVGLTGALPVYPLMIIATASAFLFDPKDDFNEHIDAPAEIDTLVVPNATAGESHADLEKSSLAWREARVG
jgi:hypothetical protein